MQLIKLDLHLRMYHQRISEVAVLCLLHMSDFVAGLLQSLASVVFLRSPETHRYDLSYL